MFLSFTTFFTPSFQKLKNILTKNSKGMKVLANGYGVYYLAYREADEELKEPNLFAALVALEQNIHLHIPAIARNPALLLFIPNRLLKYLDEQKKRFIFPGTITGLHNEIDQLLKLAKMTGNPHP